jgi:hypothetical protein
MKRPPVVVVTWDDACVHWGTHAYGDVVHEPSTTQHVGFLIRRDGRGITLAYSWDEDGDTNDQMFIPSALIRRVQKLA